MAGEFGESVDGSACGTTNVDALMQWFDQENAGYAAWTWDTWGACLQLITDYTTGNPNGNWGTDFKAHVTALNASTPTPTVTSIATAGPTPTASGSAVILGNFENTMDRFAGNNRVTGMAPATYAPAVALGSYALWTQYSVPWAGAQSYLSKTVNMDLSSDSTLRMSVYAVQPTVTGTGIELRFMAEGSNGAWYSSANTVVPIGTRTMLTWNMSGVPRAPLKQIRVCWQFTTSAKSWGNVLYVDAVEAS